MIYAIDRRLLVLGSVTRVGSEQILGKENFNPPYGKERTAFLGKVRKIAEEFHSIVHATDQERFVGNCSFRCLEGFPSYREEGGIYVSPRNVDKRGLFCHSMVFVEGSHNLTAPVRYRGTVKPSVDTPVQRALYNHYPKANYMIHGHVYVQGAPTTTGHPIPCGALEEVTAITKILPREKGSQAVNLIGHGFLAMAEDIADFDELQFVERKFPEQFVYLGPGVRERD